MRFKVPIEELIKKDVEKICEYLGIKEIPEIELRPDSDEGLTYPSHKYILIGTKKGYKRRLLIHELIHCLEEIKHTYPSNFYAASYSKDELSKFIEKKLFK